MKNFFSIKNIHVIIMNYLSKKFSTFSLFVFKILCTTKYCQYTSIDFWDVSAFNVFLSNFTPIFNLKSYFFYRSDLIKKILIYFCNKPADWVRIQSRKVISGTKYHYSEKHHLSSINPERPLMYSVNSTQLLIKIFRPDKWNMNILRPKQIS